MDMRLSLNSLPAPSKTLHTSSGQGLGGAGEKPPQADQATARGLGRNPVAPRRQRPQAGFLSCTVGAPTSIRWAVTAGIH